MKIYNTISHRSIEVDPQLVNIAQTKKDEAIVHLKNNPTGYKAKHICTTYKTWNKICTVPRKSW